MLGFDLKTRSVDDRGLIMYVILM